MICDMTEHESIPSITVIIAVYNGATTLTRCLDSVLGQTHAIVELIVIDGGSTDATLALLEANDARIRYWESKPDRGIYHAWNKGLQHASGEWICFLGADDYFWSEDALERMAAVLNTAYPACRIVYGRIAVVNGLDEVLYEIGEDWSSAGQRFHDCMSVPHPGLMHHRSLFADLGPFDESYRIAGDYELLLRELKKAPARFVDDLQPIVGMRVGGISSQPHQALLQLKEVRRAQRSLGFTKPGPCWLMAMARVYLRLILWRLLGENDTRTLARLRPPLQGKPVFWTRT